MSLVNPGVGETRAKPAWPASRFSKEDFPTFERPMKANSGSDSSGHASKFGALQSNMADEICTINNGFHYRNKTVSRIEPIFPWGTAKPE